MIEAGGARPAGGAEAAAERVIGVLNARRPAKAAAITALAVKAIAVVIAGLVAVDTVGLVEALFGVGGDSGSAAATDIARMVIGAEGRGGFGVADNGTALMRSADLAGLSGGVVEFFAAAADIRFIKEALQGSFGGA